MAAAMENKIFFSSENMVIQRFSLPNTILYYATKTSKAASSNLYCKIYFSCKYFWHRLRIIPCENLEIKNSALSLSCGNEKIEHKNGAVECSNYLSKLCDKFCFYGVLKLTLFYQHITFAEYKHLTPNLKELKFCYVSVTDLNGTIVPVEELLKWIPNISKCILSLKPSIGNYTSESAEKMLALPVFPNLNKFYISDIPKTFDFTKFIDFIKKNSRKTTPSVFKAKLNRDSWKSEYSTKMQTDAFWGFYEIRNHKTIFSCISASRAIF